MSPTTHDVRSAGRRPCARASAIIRGVMSSPSTAAPRSRRSNAMSPVPHARSSTRQPAWTPAQIDQPRLPAPVAAERQQPRDEVVAIRDRRKQPANVPALGVGRVERASGRAAIAALRNIMTPMLPSQTVENYLKTIFLAQAHAAASADELVPMGQLASALGVVPGTATTMVKTLSESGLVHYEPYMGVRLTPAGEKLAGLVLRRHRLIELFLVKVLGHELGRSARRSRAARARRLRAPDRSHRRDARPARRRSARRSDSDARKDECRAPTTSIC